MARGTVRVILGRYLEIAPCNVRFSYTRFGKPSIDPEDSRSTLSFNVSHSHGLALLAVTRQGNVGIDLERIRRDWAYEEIAKFFFSPREIAMLWALPQEMRAEGFFNCWTRKEAYVKARGEGLSHPLDRFVVSLAPGEPAALLDVVDEPRDRERWFFQALTPAPDYAATLVVEKFAARLVCWDAQGNVS